MSKMMTFKSSSDGFNEDDINDARMKLTCEKYFTEFPDELCRTIEYSEVYDSIEHFKILDGMRLGGLEYVKNESQYADLFVYNYFAYLISLLPLYMQNLLTTIPLVPA
jgi:hypothetical protein